MRGLRARDLAVVVAVAAAPASAAAKPSAPPQVCEVFPTSPACAGAVAECSLCHTSTSPVAWNAYGASLLPLVTGDFDARLRPALEESANADADGDGVSNAAELAVGTAPGVPDEALCPGPLPRATQDVFATAFARVGVLYCGRSPSYEEREAFLAGNPDESMLDERLHAALEVCLASTYWRDVGLARVADRFVRPIYAVGRESPVNIVIGDYDWDYALFRYVMLGDRDVRDLLLADYHVRDVDGVFERVDDPILIPGGGAGGQPLVPDQRAGMITTQWFFATNTMFSALPRTTAAAAYRLYLGMDIARLQGIWPVEGEPVDVDEKGVEASECAVCHSTLDPLSYAFAYYEGIVGGSTGVYNAARPGDLMPQWDQNAAVMFGQPVANVVEWAAVAAQSDAFSKTIGMTLFRHALGREPAARELPEVEAWWRSLPTHGGSVNRLIHGLVDLPAFGGA